MEASCPSIWPEEKTPDDVANCTDCGLYTHGSRMIWGEGNPHAPIMIVLDNPGAREDREGNPFVCGTRETLQKAAYEVGVSAEDLYVTYILKRRPVKAYDKERTREKTTVSYHPLAVRRRPNLWKYFMEDWRFLVEAYRI
ncbi:uracil-DNA glycosylase family protein [Brevibacillus dissolubilis]|uniref:uracil-DNA glycosylase family protein n=1 Tax=Brevibacillus dissolubilis TaxID=1844116 RepID=UPI0011179640|nr:uracil-DNA glycosylase family protein [Brevibacillus dissolubilis]